MPQINAKKSPPRKLLTVKDVAELDNCSEKTVRRAIAAGLLEVIRVGPGGRLIRIDPAAHAAYRQAQCW
ncbi:MULTISPECIES: helix-turn-helix domain-containing protein [Ruegeria]|uniref:helix-turn-helix domain-containing protein n=1 Tax=Ruegeria TaxID=97050 RepID=UPI0014799B43|nr:MULTISPECIES: helix-turn-helix domain-containing protein [Ruegeria]NOD49263.1 helix-turn-helix domain-containing protein [Ruegeria sp. HKCCD5849]NOD53438.1 helix-turn-helix domain-containing protein [Ruegeria sp. HKCCD5851]NOD70252.1 helix-turn-helix domain-containing protein [Ruegeria sp. HKCCD7303]